MKKQQCVVQAQLCRCVMTLEVKGSSSSGILICANGTFLNFTPREFGIITGLNCVSKRYDFSFDEGVPNRMVEKYFSGTEIIQKRQLFLAFTERVWEENNDVDAEKFAIMYFLHLFVLSNGMPLAIQVWLYECCSNVPPKNASKVPPPRKSNEHSKNKQKVDSLTPVVKKHLKKKQVDSFDKHTQTRTPAPRAAKADGMKTPIFKPIPTRQTSSSKTAKEKQTTREQVEDIEGDKAANVDEGGLEQSGQHFSPDIVQSPDNISDGTKQQHADKDPELQNMDYVGTEKSPQRLSLEVDQELEANLLGRKTSDEKIDEIILSDSQFIIPDEMKEKVDHDKRGKPEIFKMHFGVENMEDKKMILYDGICRSNSHIDVWFYFLRKKSKYGPHSSYKNKPNKSYKYSTVDCNFMNVISFVNDVYSMDAQNLKDGGQEHHLMEYINGFRMYTAVPWHTVEDIFISINIKEKHHWIFAILSFSERCIFLYDSYESSDHYATFLAEIEKIAKIIPLCLQACVFYVKKGINHQSHLRYKDKESSDVFDILFQDDLPQQPSGSLDYGVFMVMYAECLYYGHKVIEPEFDANALRTRYVVLLWDYGIRKQEANTIVMSKHP
ncbi:hypothetical protein FXO38_35591 [Capsicum annuum]|nr:hypothetical protein FXO38_35591 [Capsicum annuum]